MNPTVDKIARHNGVAGQYALIVTVTYRYPDAPAETLVVSFIGSEFGAPVVMETDTFPADFVSEWRRFGDTLDSEWVRNFFGAE